MNSWEEDRLFEEHGWYKNLIQRRWEGPRGHYIGFDQVMDASLTPRGEQDLKATIQQYGERKDSK